jgi:hypothetical protein
MNYVPMNIRTLFKKFSFSYFLLYFGIAYHFFVSRSFYYIFSEKTLLNKTEFSFEISTKKRLINLSNLEKKLLIDFLYKSQNTKFLSSFNSLMSVSIDEEGKIIGYKKFLYEKYNYRELYLPSYKDKKFLHSTIFGSIKLIRI